MGRERSMMGNLRDEGVISILEDAYRDAWSGQLLISADAGRGSLWLIRGQAVHAQAEAGNSEVTGMNAFEELTSWREGDYVLREAALPPARTIRLPMADLILASKQMARREEIERGEGEMFVPAPLHTRLDGIIEGLRSRVPGIESLSVHTGEQIESSSSLEAAEREWIEIQLKLLATASTSPETIYMKHQGRMLLVLGGSDGMTVLSAKDNTSPEALLWAGQEARRRLKIADSDRSKD